LIRDLVVAAVNQAIGRGNNACRLLRDLTGGLPLPGGFHEALAKFTQDGTAGGGD
jgi:hypothetical protein